MYSIGDTKLKIDFEECLRDSPKFRSFLDGEEKVVDHLELKLEKVLRMCTIAVDSGKEYVKNQSAFATSVWDLQTHFREHKTAHNALGKVIDCLQEMNKFHTILLDQANRIVLKNLTAFLKTDVREVKEYKHLFVKVSENLDTALTRNAQANKNRTQDVTEAVNLLSAATSCFRHTALDYVNLLIMLQAKKVPEILSTLLSYHQACNTFYHQGYDLCNDFDQFFRGLADDINDMRTECNTLKKSMENRHLTVSQFCNDTISSKTTSTTINRIEGYLFKRTTKGFKQWKRKWFYLCDNQLVYKKRGDSYDDIPTIMEHDLRLCTVRPVNDSDRRFCFEVISPSKSHILQADSMEMLSIWIDALHKNIGAAIHNRCSDTATLNGSTTFPGVGNFKKMNWEQFLKIPGNSLCCDCGHTEPRWASINLGITLCIACSGVHRSLGVHYSKVRSLTLDAWEPEIVKVMFELGNECVNKIYEAVPDDQIQHATANSVSGIREGWIKAKYVEKKFVRRLSETIIGTPIDDDDTELRNKSLRPETEYNSGPNRWSVRRLRRRTKMKKSEQSNETESTSSIVFIGSDLSKPLDTETELGLSSDQESTGGEDDGSDLITEFPEDISTLTPNLVLYKAAAVHNIPVMCQALASGADKNWQNKIDRNRTPLHQAVLSGSVMACEYLLLNGTTIDLIDEQGYTPLHLATEKGCTAQAYLLLKHRAKHDIIAGNGKKPIDIAVEQANADIVTLLRLTRLNEEIGIEDQGAGEQDTYNDVMKDFSRFAVTQPQRLQRNVPKIEDSPDDS